MRDACFYSWFGSVSLIQAESPIRSNWFMSTLINQTKHRQSKKSLFVSMFPYLTIPIQFLIKFSIPWFKSPSHSKCKGNFSCLGKILNPESWKKNSSSSFIYLLNIDIQEKYFQFLRKVVFIKMSTLHTMRYACIIS